MSDLQYGDVDVVSDVETLSYAPMYCEHVREILS